MLNFSMKARTRPSLDGPLFLFFINRLGSKVTEGQKEAASQSKNINDRKFFASEVTNQRYLDPGPRGKKKRIHVIWADEVLIHLHGDVNRQNHRIRTSDPDKVPVVMKPKYGVNVMVAGAISANGKSGLIFFEEGETVRAKNYQEKVLPVYKRFSEDLAIFPGQDMVTFMHDGAPAHKANTTTRMCGQFFRSSGDLGFGPEIHPT